MTVKEAVIDTIRRMPDDVQLPQIIAALRSEIRGGAIDSASDFDWPAEDLTDDEWMQMICHSWAEDLNDPRQDIYTLDDGTPINGPG